MVNLFALSRKPFVVCYCFREPIKTLFFDACQMKKKKKKNSVRNLQYGPKTRLIRDIYILSWYCRYFYSVEERLLWYCCYWQKASLGMKFSTEDSLHFVLPSAERVSSMNWVRDTQIIWTEVLSANLLFLGILQSPRGCNFEINYWKSFCFYHIDFCLVSLIYSFDVIFLPVIWQRANRWLLVTVVVVVIVILEALVSYLKF